MDAKAIAKRRGVALARIETALEKLSKEHGFSSEAAQSLKRVYSDPAMMDMFRLEGIANLVYDLAAYVEVCQKVAKPAGPAPSKDREYSAGSGKK